MAEPATCFPIVKKWSEEERETLLSQMFYFQALRVGEKKKRQSWQPFPRFVHLKAALRRKAAPGTAVRAVPWSFIYP